MNKHIENTTCRVKEPSTFLAKLFEIFFVDLYDASHHEIKSKTSFVNATQNLDDSLRRLNDMFNGVATNEGDDLSLSLPMKEENNNNKKKQ